VNSEQLLFKYIKTRCDEHDLKLGAYP